LESPGDTTRSIEGTCDAVNERSGKLRPVVQQLVDRLGDQTTGDWIAGPERMEPVSDLLCHY
jgi:hypothetical protein